MPNPVRLMWGGSVSEYWLIPVFLLRVQILVIVAGVGGIGLLRLAGWL